jgi:hypothetical protein
MKKLLFKVNQGESFEGSKHEAEQETAQRPPLKVVLAELTNL